MVDREEELVESVQRLVVVREKPALTWRAFCEMCAWRRDLLPDRNAAAAAAHAHASQHPDEWAVRVQGLAQSQSWELLDGENHDEMVRKPDGGWEVTLRGGEVTVKPKYHFRADDVKVGRWKDWTEDQPFPRCEPLVTPCRAGFMARTPDDHPYGLAVIERTEPGTLVAFETMLDRWTELHDRSRLAEGWIIQEDGPAGASGSSETEGSSR